MRVLLLTRDHRTARLVDELLQDAWGSVHLATHATWDAAAAQALLAHPGCLVLLDVAPEVGDQPGEEAVELLEYVRMSAPEAPIVLLTSSATEPVALPAIRKGAQDCLVTSELDPAAFRRALTHAIERKRAEGRLARQALHDQLTDLPNRALFLDRLGVALERSRRSGAPLAVLFLDFDNFKQINDSRGHAAGDQLLATLGHRLSGLLRPMDTVARFGGDEFTFLFEGLTSEREVVLIADRIREAASLPIEVDGGEVTVTVSIGIAIVADPSVTPETVLREADAAMYRAKQQGRARYELFDDDSRRRAIERLDLEAAIAQALERGELRVHYQPTLLLDDVGQVTGVEALVRWQHPMRGLIPARDFLPLARDAGLAIPIGRFVVRHAVGELGRWRARRPDMTISLNISSSQLRDPALPSLLTEAIRAARIDPAAVCLEVSEAELAADHDAAISALEKLKATGVRLAIDDFGAGASSLARLRELPIDALKIHESFVSGLGASPAEASVLGALIELGHALGMDVVAEGVETEAQLEQLRRLGCDAVQGFAIGRPVSGEQMDDLLVAEVA